MNELVDDALRRGFNEARQITKTHAKTFFFASRFLAKEKRLASYAVYAICRISDHAVDQNTAESARQTLRSIKINLDHAYSELPLKDNVLKAFRETVNKYRIPRDYFDELLHGMEMDLQKNRYANFDELFTYCYRVAGVVGLIMLKIFGSGSRDAEKYAVDLGVAMQLTNILRDIKEDYSLGRIYLPREELDHFGIDESFIARGKIKNIFKDLIKFQIKRAREYYRNADQGIPLITDASSRLVVSLMKEMYAGILKSIEKNDYDVFSQRAHVNIWGKLRIALQVLFKACITY